MACVTKEIAPGAAGLRGRGSVLGSWEPVSGTFLPHGVPFPARFLSFWRLCFPSK